MKKLDAEKRKQEIIERFSKMSPEEAQREITVLPFYHQLENEIVKPNLGVYITRYFLSKWKPALGESSNVFLALRLVANMDG